MLDVVETCTVRLNSARVSVHIHRNGQAPGKVVMNESACDWKKAFMRILLAFPNRHRSVGNKVSATSCRAYSRVPSLLA